MRFIIANWKCQPQSLKKAQEIFLSTKKELKGVPLSQIEIVICPPFLYLQPLRSLSLRFSEKRIKLGAQDVFWEQKGGSFTGEISPSQLLDLKINYVLVGHSERRGYLKESNVIIRKKLKGALRAGLRPVLCLGETASQKENKTTFKVLRAQIVQGLKGLKRSEANRILIAYEPVWAIGSQQACPREQAVVCALYIKKVLSEIFSKKLAQDVPILYGGSVNQKNAAQYLSERGFNGLLIGSASLDPRHFSSIVKLAWISNI